MRRQPQTTLTGGVIALLLITVAPLGGAEAQVEAVGRQLGEAGQALESAVLRGEMSEADAWARWYEVKEEILADAISSGAITDAELATLRRDLGKAELREKLETAGSEIKAAYNAGDMTEQEARDAWQAARDQQIADAVEDGTISADDAAAFQQDGGRSELEKRLDAAGEEIRLAAAAGELSEDEAWGAWYEARDTLLADAVETGEISEAEAETWLAEIHKAELNEKLKAAGERARVAAVNGDLTEEEAWASWHEDRDALIGDALAAGEISEDMADAYHSKLERMEVGQRLKSAVARDDLTSEEAAARWAEYEEQTGRTTPAPAADSEQVDDSVADDPAATDDPGTPAEQASASPADDDWARYTREFIVRYRLNEQQQERAWRFYRTARERRDATMQRLERIASEAARAGAERRVTEARQRMERDHARLFEGLKADLERLPTRSQRRATEQP